MKALDIRIARLRRLVTRAREVPLTFLLWKLAQKATVPWWSLVYATRCRSPWFQRTGRVAARRVQTLSGREVFRREYGEAVSRSRQDQAHRAWVLDRAVGATQGRIPILGFGVVDVGRPIRWDRDNVTGYRWPSRPALLIDFVADGHACDVKVAWELNRLQMLPQLGQAFLVEEEPRYLDAANELVDDWARCNPMGVGIAWSCTMDVAIRALNLVAFASMAWDHLSRARRRFCWRLIEEHARYVRRHPERSDLSGNHYLMGCAAAVQLSGLLARHSDGGTWAAAWARRCWDEIRNQFLPDGVNFEFATNYHRFMTEVVVMTLLECERFGQPVPGDVRDRARAAVSVLQRLAGPDGQLPLIGDCDSSQVLVLDAEPANATRFVCALASHLGLGPDAGSRASDWWLAGESPAAQPEVVQASCEPLAVDLSGFVVLRNDQGHCVSRSGEPGMKGRAGHDHGDLTAPVLWLGGVPVLVDPGTHSYTFSRRARAEELSGRRHSVLIIDQVEPVTVIEGSVMPAVSPRTRGRASIAIRDGVPEARLSHDGFTGVGGLHRYERHLRLGTTLECVDELHGVGWHEVEANWYLAPVWVRWEQTARGRLHFSSAEGVHLVIDLDQSWTAVDVSEVAVHPAYGASSPSLRVHALATVQLPLRLTTGFSLEE